MSTKNALTHSRKQKALALFQSGRLKAAREICEQIARADPQDAEVWCVLAAIHGIQKRFEKALHCGEHAVAIRPDYAEAWNNISAACEALGRYPEAEAAARRALAVLPDYTDAYFNLGNALKGQKRYEDALHPYGQALQRRPADAEIWVNLGLCHMWRKSLRQAEECFREALKRRPGYVDAYSNLGATLHSQGKLTDAAAMLREAIRLEPACVSAHFRLGLVLNQEGQPEEAARHFEECLRLKHETLSTWVNLGGARLNQGRVEEAVRLYRKGLSIRQDDDEEPSKAHSCILLALNYKPETDAATLFAEHVAWGRAYSHTPPAADTPAPPDPVGGRLKIGYVSPDLRRHSVAYFLEPILAHHGAETVEVFCYANVARADDTTRRLQKLAHHWRDIWEVPDDEVADTIRADGIHILVDLAGHTGGNCLRLFARRPAPVQVSYLGYPNTTGVPQIDYRLTDALADPPGQEAFHTERLVRLPAGFLCYRPADDAPPVAPPPVLGVGHVTFGSFNTIPKINERVVALWAKILKAVPHSRLLLKNRALRDAATRMRYTALFESEGIAPERIETIGWLDRSDDHLTLYNRIDIALDTFPYNGTTTTCEAMWMGVPVVTLAGDRHAGRVGVSLLTQVGLAELIAKDPEEYVQLAVELAGNPERLSRYRATMRERMQNSPLCDAKTFTRDLEEAYREMWRTWRAHHDSPPVAGDAPAQRKPQQ